MTPDRASLPAEHLPAIVRFRFHDEHAPSWIRPSTAPPLKRCAVIIGVDETGDLPRLSAAAAGARDFNDWAVSQGIDTTLLTDVGGARVTLGAVKTAVAAFVGLRVYDQIIVFFAGHGVLPAPSTEMWLLSGAPGDPNEAVDVTSSIEFSRDSRIPNVVMISDACRSRTTSPRLANVKGGAIFPNMGVTPPRAEVDVFYAAMPGNPSMEALEPNVAAGNYKGIFTEYLLKGLSCAVPAVIHDQHPHDPRWVVTARKLKPYLETEVPAAAARISLKLNQDPDVRAESAAPKYLARVPESDGSPGSNPKPPQSDPARPTPPDAPPGPQGTMVGLKGLRFDIGEPTRKPAAPGRLDPLDSRFAVDRLLQAKGRESFETRTGFTIVGSGVRRAAVTGTKHEVFFDHGATQVRVYESNSLKDPHTMLLQLDSGIGIPLAVLYGMIGTVVVEAGEVVTVSYLPSRNNQKFLDYQMFAEQLDQRRAFAAVAARNGAFRIEGAEEVRQAAGFLRTHKSVDPTLGLYAAYAYAQAGDIGGVSSIYGYMREEPEPVLFDVALLARRLKDTSEGRRDNWVAPFCPMLTQGWSFARSLEVPLPEIVTWASRNMLPGLWTTFNPEAAERLCAAIERNSIQ